MNTPASFPLAKLLKEKGIDDESAHYYNEKGELLFDVDFPSLQPTKPHIYYSAPTIADVAMWLYDKHGIWINIYYKSKYKSWDYEYTNINWSQEEVDKKLEEDIHNLLDNIFNAKIKYNSPTEAYEAAIKYTLKNLI